MAGKTITFITTFLAGAGSITFTGVNGLDNDVTLSCDAGNPQSPQTFTATQSPGGQDITVGGTAPDGGNITVEVKDAETSLTKATYTGVFMDEDLMYTVKTTY